MKMLPPKLFQKLLTIRELSGFNVNLSRKTARKFMTQEDHKKEVEAIKTKVMATTLAQVSNCTIELRALVDNAFYRASRSNNPYVQGKLTEASMKLNELLEIIGDPVIQEFVGPINDEDMRRIKRS